MSTNNHNGGPPLDTDVPDMTYVKFYPADFLNGTTHLSLEMVGAYIRTLCVMYDRMGGFPYDEREGGVLLRVDKRVYRRVRDYLLADGKFYRDGDMIRNVRVEREIEVYITEYVRRSNAAKKREAERRARETSAELPPNFARTSAELPPNLSEKSEGSSANLSQKTQQKQRNEDHNETTYQKPEARSQKPEARIKKDSIPPTPHSGAADDLPSHVQPIENWNTAFAEPHDGFIEGPDGSLQMINGKRAFWLNLFDGDETSLELALIEARAGIQPNSRLPRKTQIERKLAQIARQRIDQDKRYAKASSKKAKTAKDVDLQAIMREMTK